MKREFSPRNYNRTPVKGYGAQPRTIMESGPYVGFVEQSAQLARNIRREYDEAYPGEAEFLRSRTAVDVMERPNLGNDKLPINENRSEIMESMVCNRVTFVVGKTGSGKSTQVPQYARDAGFDLVIQTQPRRLAAKMVAERISEEIAERRPDLSPHISAYHTGEHNTATAESKIVNVTAGVLFTQDIHEHSQGVNTIRILDEVHEQDLVTDMTLALTLEEMKTNPDMRLVIQTATPDIPKYQKYIADVLGVEMNVIEVEGRTHGVEIKEFPEETSVERAIARAKEMYELDKKQKAPEYNGPILPTDFMVVCPGVREIKDWTDEILAGLPPEIAQTVVLPPLYSKQSNKEQDKALRMDYLGLRIVMATNTAKTSVTVDGLGGVIDCGYARHEVVDSKGVTALLLYATSYADRMQWAGRVGRTAPGWSDQTCMNKDMSFTPLQRATAQEIPEAQRINVDQYILSLKRLGYDVETMKLINEVPESVFKRGKENLRILGAFDDDNELTAIGRRMVDFSIGTNSARMMVEADQHSQEVRSYMAAITASHEAGGLPLFAHGVGRRWKGENGLTQEESSDLLAQLDIFIKVQNQNMSPYEQRWYNLDERNLAKAKETYWKLINKSGAFTGLLKPPTPEQREEIIACICAGLPGGVYTYAGKHERADVYTGVGRDRNTLRTLGNRSIVDGKFPIVVATPRRVEKYANGVPIEKEIIETVTVVENPAVLGQVALSQCVLKEEATTWQDGRLSIIRRQFFHNIDLGITEELAAVPSPATRKVVIAHALENPGPAQQNLREIKKELERLNHLTETMVPQLTQEELVGRVKTAAPDDILDPFVIDYNLQQMNVTIDDYLSADERKKIKENAPTEIDAEGVQFTLAYRNGQPLVYRANQSTVTALHSNVYLPDGREVKFVYQYEGHSKVCSALDFPR